MINAIKGLFSSKKFYMVILGTVVINVMAVLGMPQDIILTVAGFFGIGVGGYALADAGKEAAKLKADK